MKAMKYLNNSVNVLLFIVLAVMALSMAVNVFCRSCLNFSISWADELSQSLLVWLTFLGAAVAVREHSHYSFNFLDQVLKNKGKTILSLFVNVLILFCAVYMLIDGIKITDGIASWLMPAMGISRAWVYGACPVGSSVMIVYCVTDIINNIKLLRV